MKKENLIAYALDFTSFLIDNLGREINQVILFGSVARGDFNKDSDIDLSIDTDIKENKVRGLFSLFIKSERQRKWELKGIKHEISLKIGVLNEWALKRSIILDGIVLYGKFSETPEKMEPYILLSLSFKGIKKSMKVKIWRKLYGYKQKVGRKIYETQGIVKELSGKRFEGNIIIPSRKRENIIDFLKKEKIKYSSSEIWSDSL